MIYNLGDSYTGPTFGGIITEKVESKDWQTQAIKYIYTIKMPCNIWVRVTI